jgi:hypothetical protein
MEPPPMCDRTKLAAEAAREAGKRGAGGTLQNLQPKGSEPQGSENFVIYNWEHDPGNPL